MGERTGGTWWGREAADLPEGEEAGRDVRGHRRRGRVLTGPMSLAISALVLYLAWWVLWERCHPASPAASGLREGDPGARLGAIRELECIGPQDPDVALPALIEGLADQVAANRTASASALVAVIQGIKLGGSDPGQVGTAVDALMGLLEDSQPTVRAGAAQALATIAILWQDEPRIIDLDVIATALCRTADDPDARARLAAVRGLGVLSNLLSDGLPPRLMTALEDESEEVRAAAAQALALFHRGLGRWLPSLLRALEGTRPECRPAYLGVLQQIRPSRYTEELRDEMLPALISALTSRDREARCHLLSSIGEFGAEAREFIPTLLAILDEPDVATPAGSIVGPSASDPVAAAVDALAQVAGGGMQPGPTKVPAAPGVIPALMKMRDSPVAGRRLAAVNALRGFDLDGALIAALIASCLDPDAAVRAAAFWALPDGVPRLRPRALDAMRDALEDDSPKVRVAAAVALYRSGAGVDPTVAALIRHGDRDPDRTVREACANVLGSLRPPAITAAVVPQYIEAIEGRETPALLRGSLIAALTHLGAEARGAVPAIVRALQSAEERAGRETPPRLPLGLGVAPLPPEEQSAELDARWRVVLRRDAAHALGRLAPGTPSAGDAMSVLAAALDDPADEVRQHAIEALVAFGPAAKVSSDALIRALRRAREKKDDYRCGRIAEVLGQIDPTGPGASEVVAFLIDVLRAEKPEPRLFAERVLGSFGPAAAPAIPRLVALIRRPTRRPHEEFACVASALGRIAPGSPGEARALAALLDRLRAEPTSPRVEAVIEAVARFGPSAATALPLLRVMANSDDPLVSEAAQRAVAALEVLRR
jgi:HEAT repeat protein